MAENGYGLAGPGMGKVKSINQYRLTPGFGGFTPYHMKQRSAAFHAADAALKTMLKLQHFLYKFN
ncbi:hypothetical protein LHS70_004714 [Escherichia coli]|nr:hypothetical protein [Escherichia coli]EHQ0061274.1 hypothetical protein [Escherichia coli]EII7560198.1 hypothetical protein [Escherichia coli]HDC1729743.1 hypothetical protein [Escherichia coli]HDC1815764.1 hypothetical protein [Escherichia coli]